MKNRLLLFSFFICLLNTYGQIDKIIMPKGNEQLDIKRLTAFYSIYVDKNESVFFEKEPIKIHDIGKLLTYKTYKLPDWDVNHLQIHLYIDKEVNYDLVDKIKTEIASANLNKVVYKTNSVEDKDILNGIFWKNHQSFFKIAKIKKRLTYKEKERNKRYNDSLIKYQNSNENPFPLPPPPLPPHWSLEFENKLYSDQQNVIDEILNERKYKCVTITNMGLKVNSENIPIEEKIKIEHLFLENEALLISFDEKLSYFNYLNMIRIFKEMTKNNKGKASTFELSSEIKMIYKKAGIELCDKNN